jgi:hypothetical protein
MVKVFLLREDTRTAGALGGDAWLPPYAEAVAMRQIERHRLRELVTAVEAEIGPIAGDEVTAAVEQVARAHAEVRENPGGAAPHGGPPDPGRPSGTLVLDGGCIARLAARERGMLRFLLMADRENLRVATSVMATMAAGKSGSGGAVSRRTLSRIRVEPVTDEVTSAAMDLLREAGLSPDEHACSGVLAATAVLAPPPVALLTSEPDELRALCCGRVAIVGA